MSEASIQTTGKLAHPNAVNDLVDSIFAEIKKQLPNIGKDFQRDFVINALSQKGPNTLGQITGNLARSFMVEPVDQGEIGSLRGFVAPGNAFFYGQVQDVRKNWFATGVQNTQDVLNKEIEDAVTKAVQENNK